MHQSVRGLGPTAHSLAAEWMAVRFPLPVVPGKGPRDNLGGIRVHEEP